MRFTGRVVFFLLAGGAALAFGLTRSEAPDLDCGGKTMRPGAVCDQWGNGNSNSYTYDQWVAEQEKNQHRTTLIWVAAGGVLIALAPISYALGVRKARRTADVGGRKTLAEVRGWQYLPEGLPGSEPDPLTEHPNVLAGTVNATAVQVWDKTRVLKDGFTEHRTHISVALPGPAKPFTARGRSVHQPRELAAVVDTPEIRAFVRQAKIDHWAVTGSHLVVTTDRIHDRQTDEKLVPLIDATIHLARILPSALFVSA